VKVSTVSSRYAFGAATSNSSYGGALLRFSRKHWRVVAIQGPVLLPCSYWTAVAPAKVLRDLRLRGTSPGHGLGPC
jgi:hypothetical protein